MNAYEIIGKKIQIAREARGMNQEELANHIGCTQSSLSYYEVGKRRIHIDQLKKICSVLDRPLKYFLEDGNEIKEYKDGIENMIREPYLRKIYSEAKAIKPSQRKLVLEYIRWQRFKSEG